MKTSTPLNLTPAHVSALRHFAMVAPVVLGEEPPPVAIAEELAAARLVFASDLSYEVTEAGLAALDASAAPAPVDADARNIPCPDCNGGEDADDCGGEGACAMCGGEGHLTESEYVELTK